MFSVPKTFLHSKQRPGNQQLKCRNQSRESLVVYSSSDDATRIAVLGASGYTGADCIRLSALHLKLKIVALTAERQAGKELSDVYPHLRYAGIENSKLVKIEDVNFADIDAVFCCLPHATTQKIVAGLPKNVKIVDLSADFRLKDVKVYEEWYGGAHLAPDLQKEAVYGMTELQREKIKSARLVANPGCYPTTAQLPLCPLLQAGLISTNNITIDAKSGVSGAGRSAKEANLYTEVSEGIHAYGVGKHRHMPEIEQGLKEFAGGKDVIVSFTPHLVPMSRGMQSTIYVEMKEGTTIETMRQCLEKQYAGEEFVKVLPEGVVPHTRHIRGSNYCFINVFLDRIPGRAIILCVIDNLVKGASGQAMQNLNLVLGFPESMSLTQLAMFP